MNENLMAQSRGCTGDATSLPNRTRTVSYVSLKMGEVSHHRGGTQFLCDSPILAISFALKPLTFWEQTLSRLTWNYLIFYNIITNDNYHRCSIHISNCSVKYLSAERLNQLQHNSANSLQ